MIAVGSFLEEIENQVLDHFILILFLYVKNL